MNSAQARQKIDISKKSIFGFYVICEVIYQYFTAAKYDIDKTYWNYISI